MFKRKFDELDEHGEGYDLPDSTTSDTNLVSYIHNLDSDEEIEDDDDGNEEVYALKEDDVEGQEEGATGFEGDIQLTPFNVKEEMEEGHFDSNGMYHWKKEDGIERDNWLESVDWLKVNKTKTDKEKDEEDSNDLSCGPMFDKYKVYEEMLLYMKPYESVARTLRRIAGDMNLTSTERWKRKKAGLNPTAEEQEAKLNVTKFTALADSILQNTGNMDVYQETYEYITNKVVEAVAGKTEKTSLDMYADDFDEKEKELLETKDVKKSRDVLTPLHFPIKAPGMMWEFKWTKDSSGISGPHSTEQMCEWTNTGYFNGDVYVRKSGSDSDFYCSKRIDFDLYL